MSQAAKQQIFKTLEYSAQHTELDMLKVDFLLLAKLAACSRWLPITDGFQYDLIRNIKIGNNMHKNLCMTKELQLTCTSGKGLHQSFYQKEAFAGIQI